MKCERLEEVLELLRERWLKEPELNLANLLKKIAREAGFEGELSNLSDEVLIYQLKMDGKDKHEPIPGIKKDYEDDFKTALLKARGIVD